MACCKLTTVEFKIYVAGNLHGICELDSMRLMIKARNVSQTVSFSGRSSQDSSNMLPTRMQLRNYVRSCHRCWHPLCLDVTAQTHHPVSGKASAVKAPPESAGNSIVWLGEIK